MYCPNCNNFVDDGRENCPYCNTQIHSIAVVGTSERRAMGKIVSSRLFVVTAIAFTLYLVLMTMQTMLAVNVLNVLLIAFGAMLVFRMWNLYLGSVKNVPESSTAGRLTGFFTVQKVISIILAIAVSFVTAVMLLAAPYFDMIADKIDELSTISADITTKHVVYAFCDDVVLAEEVYAELEAQELVEDLQILIDNVENAVSLLTQDNDLLIELINAHSFGFLFKICMYVIMAVSILSLLFNALMAIYMSKLVRFISDFSTTWDGLAPWKRGARYGVWIGYFLSLVLFIMSLYSVLLIPRSFGTLIYLSACVAMFGFSKFISRICYVMDELYRLGL